MELASTPRCVCHMKGMEVPSVKPLGQAPMGMEGASCGEHERESCLRTGLEGTFMPFVLPCLKSLKSSEGGEGSFVEVGGVGGYLAFRPKTAICGPQRGSRLPCHHRFVRATVRVRVRVRGYEPL